jgi:predicted alpha/beta superfamily hydrolase
LSGWLPYQEVHGSDNTVSGTVLVWPSLASPQLGGSREILAYLPPSLAAARGGGTPAQRRHPVIYFHDGQNLFDERTSYAGEWHADETLERLAGEGLEVIAVGVPHGRRARMEEYNPWRARNPRDWLRRHTGGRGDDYLAFLVDTVKPLIDSSFPTHTERESTGIFGSSMGGFISLYGLLTRPQVFGLAGVMSPAIFWADYRILRLIEERGLPPARIHLDMGGREWRGMLEDARRLREQLIAKGCVEGRDLRYVEDPEARHNEDAWARRLPDALRFLLRGG